MLFSIHLLDGPDSAASRERLVGEHKGHVARIADQLAFAGPLLDPSTGRVSGSLIVAEFDDEEAVHAWIGAEPYYCAGVYASVEVMRFANYWPQRAGFPPDQASSQ